MNMKTYSAGNFFRITTFVLLLAVTPGLHAADKLKALIVDGQNNHKVWPKSTVMMKQYLEATGLFEVDVARTSSFGAPIGRRRFCRWPAWANPSR